MSERCTIVEVFVSIPLQGPFGYRCRRHALIHIPQRFDIASLNVSYSAGVRIAKKSAVTASVEARVWPRVRAKIAVTASLLIAHSVLNHGTCDYL